jgi:uncharacterized membrane protein YeaQ/YmgE (transglycosylase-associated protein family)
VAVDHRWVAGVTIVCGLLLGAVDLLLQHTLPGPWANLADSPAVWALVAYALGLWVRAPWWRAALAGVVLLVLATPSYYLAAKLTVHGDLAGRWATPTLVWMLFGLVAGFVFGTAGAFATASGWHGAVAVAMPGAVLFAEALLNLLRVTPDDRWTALIKAALGVLVIVALGRGRRQRLTALAFSVPLAAVGFGALYAGGFRP